MMYSKLTPALALFVAASVAAATTPAPRDRVLLTRQDSEIPEDCVEICQSTLDAQEECDLAAEGCETCAWTASNLEQVTDCYLCQLKIFGFTTVEEVQGHLDGIASECAESQGVEFEAPDMAAAMQEDIDNTDGDGEGGNDDGQDGDGDNQDGDGDNQSGDGDNQGGDGDNQGGDGDNQDGDGDNENGDGDNQDGEDGGEGEGEGAAVRGVVSLGTLGLGVALSSLLL